MLGEGLPNKRRRVWPVAECGDGGWLAGWFGHGWPHRRPDTSYFSSVFGWNAAVIKQTGLNYTAPDGHPRANTSTGLTCIFRQMLAIIMIQISSPRHQLRAAVLPSA